jgi:hypothetical protein
VLFGKDLKVGHPCHRPSSFIISQMTAAG